LRRRREWAKIARVICFSRLRRRPLAGAALAMATAALTAMPPARAAETASVVAGGPRHAVSRWEMKDGLPLNKVRAVAQTPDGYLWVGTFNGLARGSPASMACASASSTWRTRPRCGTMASRASRSTFRATRRSQTDASAPPATEARGSGSGECPEKVNPWGKSQ